MNTPEAAATALAAGQVVGIPTETVYGLAVDPYAAGALRRLSALKWRDPEKPIALLGVDLEALEPFGEFTPLARELARAHWPGPLTMVLATRGTPVDGLGDPQRRTVGLRIPDHPVALALLARTGPLAVTSANLSGHAEALDDTAARAMFGDAVSVWLPGTSTGGAGSTVVDLTTTPPTILRPGPITLSF